MELNYIGTGNTSWFSDNSYFSYTSNPFMMRGGHYNNGTGAGLYYFNNYNGNHDNVSGGRVVLGV